MLRAGFTDVPVIGMHTMWTSTRVSPMASPAKLPAPFFSSVAPRTTSTKMNVNTISAIRACHISPASNVLAPVAVQPASFAPVEVRAKRMAEPMTAPQAAAAPPANTALPQPMRTSTIVPNI